MSIHELPTVHSLRTLALAVALVATARAADPIPVADFDFEGGMGQADAQGWRPLHRFQNEEAHYHVDDFGGAGQSVSALSGSQSMWCGLPAEDPRTCHWQLPPGYGSDWSEDFESVAFAVQGDVTLSFLAEVGIEEIYDFVQVQYLGSSGQWETLDSYSCQYADCIALQQQYLIPAASHDGSIRFRFYFDSDGYGDAEQALFTTFVFGFLLDDLTVSDATGVVDFQDFESESIGDAQTADGNWSAAPHTDFYDGGILVDGTQVLQESAQTNDTHVWGFFKDSTRDYGCAGHPEQLVVDETRSRILSPRIDLMHDLDGYEIQGDADSLVVEFDVYRDIAGTEQKHYWWRIATYSPDCLIDKFASAGSAYGDQKDWYRHRIVFVPDPGTTSLEIDLGVEHYHYAENMCRSASPLIDNVNVARYAGTVVAVGDGPPRAGALLHQNFPNPFNPRTLIEFEVPTDARQVALAIYDGNGRRIRSLLHGPMPPGLASVPWDGRDAAGRRVASGVYFYELTVDGRRESRRMALIK